MNDGFLISFSAELSRQNIIWSRPMPESTSICSRIKGSIGNSRRCRRLGRCSSKTSKSNRTRCCGSHSIVSGAPEETEGLQPSVIGNSIISIVEKSTCLGLMVISSLFDGMNNFFVMLDFNLHCECYFVSSLLCGQVETFRFEIMRVFSCNNGTR